MVVEFLVGAVEARAALVSLIGGDRQASRSEIQKLLLYAHGSERITLDDVLAVVADASALALDVVVDCAFAGRAPEMEANFSKALAAGTSAGTILFSALRHVTQLHKARLRLRQALQFSLNIPAVKALLDAPRDGKDLGRDLLALLSAANINSKNWISTSIVCTLIRKIRAAKTPSS